MVQKSIEIILNKTHNIERKEESADYQYFF